MMLEIALTVIIVFVLGLAFAITSHKLGRGDKRPGCGHGTCSSCNPANRNAECPSETGQTGLFAGLVANPAEDDDLDDTDTNDTDTDDTDTGNGGQAADFVNG